MATTDLVTPTSLREGFDRDGFVVIRGFLPDDDFRELTDNLDRYIRDVVPRLPDGDAFYDDRARPETLKQLSRIEQDPYFKAYTAHPLWKATAEEILGESVLFSGAEWFNKPPGTNHATPAHQDNFYFCLTPPRVLTMWLALDEVDDENGCLRYVRGSHLRGIRPHGRTKTLGFSQGVLDYGPDDAKLEAAIHARPNDLLIHHGETIHLADANRSAARHRRSFALVFKGASCRRDEAAFARYQMAATSQHREMGLNV
jgi:phytanoyl-CoA hydroxylase